jgi:hypothetical protein
VFWWSSSIIFHVDGCAPNKNNFFTTNTSPLNAAVVIEEVYREYSDRKAPFYLALLDAKSAFDVVDIDILMRKLFLLGVQPSTWKIIDELHQNTKTAHAIALIVNVPMWNPSLEFS